MTPEPIDYARPSVNRREAIHYGATTDGFFIEVDPPGGNPSFYLILGVIAVVMAFSILRVSSMLALLVLAAGVVIGIIERAASRNSLYASFQLDGDELIVHHNARRVLLSWASMIRFTHARVPATGEHTVEALLASDRSIQLYRSDRGTDVARIVQILSDEKRSR
jgi:hypothetical protein